MEVVNEGKGGIAGAISGNSNDNTSLVTQMVTAAILWSLGDFLAQKIESHKRGSSVLATLMSEAPYNYKRTARMALFAALYFSPLTNLWFKLLQDLFPGELFEAAVKRVLLDQTFYATFMITSVFAIVSLMEGKKWEEIIMKIKVDLFPTLQVNWLIWPFVQLFNMYYISPPHRLLIANIVNVPWTAYLAYKTSLRVEDTWKELAHIAAVAAATAANGGRPVPPGVIDEALNPSSQLHSCHGHGHGHCHGGHGHGDKQQV